MNFINYNTIIKKFTFAVGKTGEIYGKRYLSVL